MPERFDRARHLGYRRDVTDHDTSGRESVGDRVYALPRCEHVEDDPVDLARGERGGQRLDQIAHDDSVIRRFLSEIAFDVGGGNLGELVASFERRHGPRLPHRLQ